MVRIIIHQGIMLPAQNNPGTSPKVGPITVRQKGSATAAKTEARKERKTTITPGKGGIPAVGETVAAAIRIMEAPGLTGTMRKKAISSE